MKKLMIFLSIIMLVDRTYAQTPANYYLSPVKIDNEVTVSLPKEFVKNAKGGEQSFAANGKYGTFFVISSQNPVNANTVKNANGLDDVFQAYIKKVQSSSGQGMVVNDHDVSMGKLQVRDFILQTDTGSGIQSRHFRLLYTKNTTYTFEYMYDDFRKDEATGEMNAFFGSVKTAADLDRNDQYVITSQSNSSVFVKIILFGLTPLGVVIGLFIYFKRRSSMSLT